MKAYPGAFKATLWWVFALLLASGLALLPNLLELRLGWTVPISTPAGSHVWLAAIHALFAFSALLVFGALLPLHIRFGLRRGEHLVTGISLMVVALLLSLTALGIYYLGDDTWSLAASIVHVCAGLLASLALTVHVVQARRRTRRMQAQMQAAVELRREEALDLTGDA